MQCLTVHGYEFKCLSAHYSLWVLISQAGLYKLLQGFGYRFHDRVSYLGEHSPIKQVEVIKLFSCSTQLSMKFFLHINVKIPTIVGILTFYNRSGKNSILGISEP